MVTLSPNTLARVELLFPIAQQAAARAVLEQECAENLPCFQASDMFGLERVRFAVLKLSGGNLERLQREINEAKLDWRDTLMAAGFGSDINAHAHWWPPPRK